MDVQDAASGGDPALPALEEVLAGAVVVALPLRVRFRGIEVREALLLRGPAGWGEFAPFLEYDDATAAAWLAAGLEAAWTGWPAPLRPRVTVNATVPAVPAARVPEVLARFPGCTTAKVKVAERGQSLDDDVARVAAVRREVARSEVARSEVARSEVARGVPDPGAARVRVDANGGWSVEEAAAALAALTAGPGQGPLEYAEQPCATVPELVALRELLARGGVDVRIAADESIRRASDPLAVVRAGAADVAVLKVPPMGGVRAVLALAEQLRAEGQRRGGAAVPVVLSSALDTAVGLSAGLAAAAALPLADGEEQLASGLGTGSLLAADIVLGGVTGGVREINHGSLPVGAVEPDPDLLERHAAAPERRAWWLERLRRCYALL
ncbi:O-succinylbenzoate synthase [Quadrisphaera granulorum]|uniref:o-succinylbenzoate synthase n=1 Tax=Quadrisphaera granulorum TaxID=317664 RepID=A0A316AF38_9ACTN|nr:O-succinylbenzoate synthase [Quadrisphaera granulorum]SZE95578.1 O-succinylbenzoate synthase [Quadrisphaera granulorum]